MRQADRVAALDRLLELTVLLGTDMRSALASRGLTESRTHLLWLLHHGGPTTQQALATALKVSARNVTGLVDGLVSTGFVTREPHPTDRRVTLVCLTEHGAGVTAELEAEQQELARALFRGMPDERFRELAAGLDQVLDRLRRLIAEAAEGATRV
jgi:DNA-binding MarR family transcriptional regulator